MKKQEVTEAGGGVVGDITQLVVNTLQFLHNRKASNKTLTTRTYAANIHQAAACAQIDALAQRQR